MNLNYKYKKTAMAALTAMVTLLLFTFALVPMVAAEEVEAEPIGATSGLVNDGTIDAIKWWLRVLPVTSNIMGVYDYNNLDNGRLDVPAGDDDAIKAFARNLDAQRSAEQQYNLLMLASNLVDIDAETWKLTDAYLNRAAEISAGTLWDESASFDADGILHFGGIYDSMSNGNLSTQDALDRAISVSVDLRDEWDATNYGSQLLIKLIWDAGSTNNALSTLHSDFCTLTTVSGQQNVVYLSQSTGDNASTQNSTIWAYTIAGTITPIVDGTTLGQTPIPLTKGSNDVSELTSGFYKLSPGTYGGPFLSSVNENAAPVKGAMGIICDDQYGYAVNNGDKITIFYDGTSYESTTLDYEITGCDETQTSHGSPFQLVNSYGKYYNQLTNLLFEASNAAQVMWTISATANSSNILLSPSSLIPHLSNVNVDPQQSYAMYIMALDQISQYNAAYGGVLKDGMTKISAQSLDLYCHGNIYSSNGTLVAENAIFTPYVYLNDWTIYSGTFNTFGQNGLIMIWDEADSAAGWTHASSTDEYQTLAVQKGTYFVPNEIIYQGEEVASLHLDVEEVQRISVFEELDWDRIDAPNVLSAATLIMIIVLELGAIVALIGYVIRMPIVIIIGLVIVLIGIIASDLIARIALGNEDMFGWLPWRMFL